MISGVMPDSVKGIFSIGHFWLKRKNYNDGKIFQTLKTLKPAVKTHLNTETPWGAFVQRDANISKEAQVKSIKRKHCDRGQ